MEHTDYDSIRLYEARNMEQRAAATIGRTILTAHTDTPIDTGIIAVEFANEFYILTERTLNSGRFYPLPQHERCPIMHVEIKE